MADATRLRILGLLLTGEDRLLPARAGRGGRVHLLQLAAAVMGLRLFSGPRTS